jgi:glycolate oxidase FAD binding subunit
VLQALRERARTLGGHLVIEAAPLAVKDELAVWDDPGPAARLMQRIKGQVDPAGMLNPGRFVSGI